MDHKTLEKHLYFLDLSNTEASKTFGITRQAINNYLSGKRPIPLWLEKSILAHIKLKKIIEVIS